MVSGISHDLQSQAIVLSFWRRLNSPQKEDSEVLKETILSITARNFEDKKLLCRVHDLMHDLENLIQTFSDEDVNEVQEKKN